MVDDASYYVPLQGESKPKTGISEALPDADVRAEHALCVRQGGGVCRLFVPVGREHRTNVPALHAAESCWAARCVFSVVAFR